MKTREKLFKGFKGCSNHDCVISKPKGMGTNGSCKCLSNMSRSQYSILTSRLNSLLNELDKNE